LGGVVAAEVVAAAGVEVCGRRVMEVPTRREFFCGLAKITSVWFCPNPGPLLCGKQRRVVLACEKISIETLLAISELIIVIT
jgi:hypothetical protein